MAAVEMVTESISPHYTLEIIYREHFGKCPSITNTARPSVWIPRTAVAGFIAYAHERGYELREV